MSDNDDKDRARLEAFDKELTLDPRSLVFVELAEEHNRQGHFDEAAAVAQKGLVYHPDSVAGRLALAMAEAGRNNNRKALEQIKRALLIDPDNSKALALMGRILLAKGLAKRAMQFLTHAVKLAPDEPEYQELLRRARKTSQGDSEIPMFKVDAMRDAASPWTESEDGSESDFDARPSDKEHTVFDPEALRKLRARGSGLGEAKLEDALSQLGDDESDLADSEPTRFDGRSRKQTVALPTELPPPRRVDSEGVEPREEPTTYDTKNPLREAQPALATSSQERDAGRNPLNAPPRKKPMVGGSAADFSKMMRSVPSEAAADAPRARPKSPAPSPPAPSSPREEAKPEAQKGAPVQDPEAKPERPKREKAKTGSKPSEPAPAAKESHAKEAPAKETPAKEAPPPKEPAPKETESPKAAASSGAPAPAEAPKPVGPAATRMVDEALWALLGGKVDSGAGQVVKATVPVDHDKKPANKERAHAAEEKEGGAKKGQGPMVVRTSERFGTAFRAAVLLVLIAAAVPTGYSLAVSTSGAPPEMASEELKGVASDLERGGLARLLAAEEKALALMPRVPQLSDLLTGALAEIYARRWASFGHDPEMLSRAREKIEALKGTRPTVEVLSAMVALSTSAAELSAIDKELHQTQKEYPESPKIWVLRAQIAQAEGRNQDAETALYTARAINPQHRMTLLELARWHAKQGQYSTAFNDFDQLLAAFPEDVEAAIERYVLGQITGKDPAESQASAILAGLVRQELADVAKDEAGRVALAFAVPKLARGELDEGIEELAKADGAFEQSAELKTALAGVYLAIGQWERAARHYNRALETDPENIEARLGLARAQFGERAELKAKAEQMRGKAWKGGVARLPFATVRFVPRQFSLVTIEPSREVFPESAFALVRSDPKGKQMKDRLEAATLTALALEKVKTNDPEEAIGLLDEAARLHDDAAVRVAFGKAYLAKKDVAAATRSFKKALSLDEQNVPAHLGLATVLADGKDLVAAIQTLEPFERSEVIVPQALLLLAKFRMQRGDYERALPALETLTDLRPKDVDALLLRGEAEHRMKKRDEALESYKKALKISPKLGEKLSEKKQEKLGSIALLYLGRLELERDESRGIALLKACAKHEDAPDEAHFYLGKALLRRPKGKKQARRELELYRSLVSNGELHEEAGRLLK